MTNPKKTSCKICDEPRDLLCRYALCYGHNKERELAHCRQQYNKRKQRSDFKEDRNRRAREYRERMKSDPDSYKNFRKRECVWNLDKRCRKYGITSEQYKHMLSSQRNGCAICQSEFTKAPFIDHCHKTGKVRGLLCSGCNTGVGHVEKFINSALLDNVMGYI